MSGNLTKPWEIRGISRGTFYKRGGKVIKTRASGSTRYGRNRPPSETRRICVAFENQTFEKIRDMAAECNVSFAEQIRTLVEWSLDIE